MNPSTGTKSQFIIKEVALKKRISVGDFQINEEEKAAIYEVLDAGRISEWKKVKEFEKLFADYIGTKHCITVNSGTSALIIGLSALINDPRFPKIRKGSKVITTPLTYVATTNAIVLTGLEPVFGWIVGIWFIAVRDGFRKPGASPGKRLFHLKVVPWNKPYRPEKAVIRNIFLILPLLNVIGILIEGAVLLLTKDPSRLIGDRMAGLRVVHASKNFSSL
jgi:hypothetical protein